VITASPHHSRKNGAVRSVTRRFLKSGDDATCPGPMESSAQKSLRHREEVQRLDQQLVEVRIGGVRVARD
jgi:hypothetical protein